MSESRIGETVDRIWVADALEFLALLAGSSVDAVITDPPYGIGLDTWDKPIDTGAFVAHVARILKPGGFLAFTITMPRMSAWLQHLGESTLTYKEHIVWLKRNTGALAAGLSHNHENILIYSKGKAKYYSTKGPYTDVKVPGVMFDAISIEGIQRYITALRSGNSEITNKRHISHKAHNHTFRNTPSERSPEFANFTTVWSFLPETRSARRVGEHASMKPVKMIERLCELLTAPDMLICDPFMGSGTTALAARNTGRHFIGCDLNPPFVELANERLAEPMTQRLPEADETTEFAEQTKLFEGKDSPDE